MGLENLKKSLEAKKAQNEGAKKNQEGGGSRTRAQTEPPTPPEAKLSGLIKTEPMVRRIVRRSATLADRITEEDMEAGMQALRDALHASNQMYDNTLRRVVVTPDAKTRLAALTLMLAYTEGTPIKRIAAIVGDLNGTRERMDAMRDSPEMLRAVRALSGLGVEIEVEAEEVQETGSETDGVASEENSES